jgi:hypothetical protein
MWTNRWRWVLEAFETRRFQKRPSGNADILAFPHEQRRKKNKQQQQQNKQQQQSEKWINQKT